MIDGLNHASIAVMIQEMQANMAKLFVGSVAGVYREITVKEH